MALTGRQPVRVTIGERTEEIDPRRLADGDLAAGDLVGGALPEGEGDAIVRLDVTGAGAGILRTKAGPRRVLWTARPPADGVQGAGGSGSGLLAYEIVVDGWRFEVSVEPAARAELRDRARRGASVDRAHASLVVRAPISGRIAGVRVIDGQAVEAGEPLLTLEAMKMENVVRAPRAGTIARVAVGAGQTVELGDTLVELA
jgi:biotin carboxyl carrier protein